MKFFDSIKEALEDLEQRGFGYDFNEDKDKIYERYKTSEFSLSEFKIVEVYRFEGTSNPSENAIVYAIESEKYNIKGYLVNAYGMYSESGFAEMVSAMELVHNEVI